MNTTDDTHPIHLHLVEFNVLDRQAFDKDRYLADWNEAGSEVTPYLLGEPIAPASGTATCSNTRTTA